MKSRNEVARVIMDIVRDIMGTHIPITVSCSLESIGADSIDVVEIECEIERQLHIELNFGNYNVDESLDTMISRMYYEYCVQHKYDGDEQNVIVVTLEEVFGVIDDASKSYLTPDAAEELMSALNKKFGGK